MSKRDLILELAKKGHSYNYICSVVHCSKSTVAYHLNDEYRKSALKRNLKNKRQNMEDPTWKRSYKWNRQSVKIKKIREHLEKTFNNKCYLSGRDIDLDNASSFHFDHIVPKSKGGTHDLDNLGLCVPEANVAKGELSVDEFIALCKDVLEHNGYQVIK